MGDLWHQLMTAELGRATQPALVVLALAAAVAAALPAGHRRVETMSGWSSAGVIAIGSGEYGRLGYTILGEYLPRGERPDSVYARITRGLRGSGCRARPLRAASMRSIAAAPAGSPTERRCGRVGHSTSFCYRRR